MSLPENPVAALLAMRHARAPVRGWVTGGVVLGLAGGLVVFTYLFGGPGGVRTALWFLALTTLALIPLVLAADDGAAITSWKRGRCFEEILGTRTGAAEVADGLAWSGAARALQMALPAWPLLMAAAGGLWGGTAVLWLALWLPALLWLTVYESYALLALSALSGSGGRGVPFQVLASAIFLSPLVFLAGMASDALRIPEAVPLLAWAAACLASGAALALALVLARQAALLGLEHGDRLQATFAPFWRSIRGARKPVGSGPSNPLAFREWARQRGRLGVGSVVVGTMVVAFWLWSRNALETPPGDCVDTDPMVTALVVLFYLGLTGLQTIRAAAATAGSIVDERESGTLSFVALTRLTPDDYLEGCAQAAWLPLAVENTLAGPLLATLAWKGGIGLSGILVAQAFLYLSPWLGTWVGLAASAGCVRRGEARVQALAWVILQGVSLPVAVLAGSTLGEVDGFVASATLLWVAWWASVSMCRLYALRDLSTEGLDGLGLPHWFVHFLRRR